MTHTRRTRRWAAATAAVLIAALAPALAAAAPAHADAGCLSEAHQAADPLGLTYTVCDDSLPPETAITQVQPAPNGKRYIKVDHVTFTYAGSYTDADADPITYQCQLGTTTAPVEASWKDCNTDPSATTVTYTGLADTGSLPYRFFVRAIDSADQPIDATSCIQLAGCTSGPSGDAPDLDESPASAVVWVDTMTPTTSAFLESKTYPVGDDDSTNPMVGSPTVQVRLASNEGGATHYACTLDRDAVPCADGITTLHGVGPGRHVLRATVTDDAGNTDPTPAEVVFYSPRNLTAGAPWRTLHQGGYYAGDVLQTARVGAVLTAPGHNVRVLRLIAPAGPQLGKVQVKIGTSIWRTVNLKAPTYERFHVYQVRDAYDPLVSGKIRIRVLSVPHRGYARVDAVFTRS